jgi:uncharacterized protein (DUF362 family)
MVQGRVIATQSQMLSLIGLNLIVHPNLVITDGRTCFITGGPSSGETRKANIMLASGDRIALGVESLKIIELPELDT